MRRVCLYFLAAVVLAISASAGPALAQTAPTTASPTDRCAAAASILAQLPAAPATPAATPVVTSGTSAPTVYAGAVLPGRGVEISAGTISGETRFGATFIGEVSGDLSGVLISSVNYTPPSPGPNVTNNIVGGEWALCGPQGTVYGNFTGGTVQWNGDESLADVAANMEILGGDIASIPVSGIGTFNGVLDHRPLAAGLSPTISGALQLQASAAPMEGGALPNTGGLSPALPFAALLIVSCLSGVYLRRRFS